MEENERDTRIKEAWPGLPLSKEEGENISQHLAFANNIIIQACRKLDSDYGGVNEVCSECGRGTGWDEAMYDLLAGGWLCPECWKDALG